MRHLALRLAHLLLKYALDPRLNLVLPFVFRRLDAEIPELLVRRASHAKVKGVVASAISDVVERRASSSEIATILALYDPTEAARNRR